MADAPNRIDPLAPPLAVSPTGIPVINPKAIPWLVAVVAAAGLGLEMLPSHTLGYKICGLVVLVGGLVGIASPGLRK